MTDKLTYEQQTQRIATLERKLAHMTTKEAQLAAQFAELEEWAYSIYVGYRDGYGWIESETDRFVVSRPDVIRQRDERDGMVRRPKAMPTD